MLDELMKRMLAAPWFNVRTLKRFGASRLDVSGTVSVADIAQLESAPASLGAAGGLGVHAAMIHRLGPPDLMTVPA